MAKPTIYADFHNADPQGRIRLNCIGTLEDLSQQQVELREGLVLTLYADDLDAQGEFAELRVDGVVSFSQEEHCWVAAIDWAAIHHASEDRTPRGNGNSRSPRSEVNEAQHADQHLLDHPI
jgi:hypothetical protein